MKHPDLQVTYRKGRFLAAYLNLSQRSADRSVRTRVRLPFVIDFAADGRPLGIEILARSRRMLPMINALLDELGLDRLRKEDVAPIVAA